MKTFKQKRAPIRINEWGLKNPAATYSSGPERPGTISDIWLNFRVRNGNGCDPLSITAEILRTTVGKKLRGKNIVLLHTAKSNQEVVIPSCSRD